LIKPSQIRDNRKHIHSLGNHGNLASSSSSLEEFFPSLYLASLTLEAISKLEEAHFNSMVLHKVCQMMKSLFFNGLFADTEPGRGMVA